MKIFNKTSSGLKAALTSIGLALAFTLTSAPVFAEKPDWAGGGKEKSSKGEHKEKSSKGEHKEKSRRDSNNVDASISFRFGSSDARIIREYYGGQAEKGKCPPGLAKKGNGCQPPGQAKKWARGRPLPSDVRYYDIPNELRIRLPAPPSNHRYVQVAGDILLIAVGTSIVVDAMEDILR